MADNPHEWFDVVDPLDRVVDRARRGEVHARGLLHRAVHILVRRADGRVFLQKRAAGKDLHPGKWDSSASGHLDCGETYGEAAERELREELGIEAVPLRLIGKLPASGQTGQEFVRIYGASHEGPFTLHPEEISEGRWLFGMEIRQWLRSCPGDFTPCFHLVWETAEPDLV